jgi:hypothetical protein
VRSLRFDLKLDTGSCFGFLCRSSVAVTDCYPSQTESMRAFVLHQELPPFATALSRAQQRLESDIGAGDTTEDKEFNVPARNDSISFVECTNANSTTFDETVDKNAVNCYDINFSSEGTSTCPHLREWFPDRLSLEFYRCAVTDSRLSTVDPHVGSNTDTMQDQSDSHASETFSWMLRNPVHALHLASQLEQPYKTSIQPSVMKSSVPSARTPSKPGARINAITASLKPPNSLAKAGMNTSSLLPVEPILYGDEQERLMVLQSPGLGVTFHPGFTNISPPNDVAYGSTALTDVLEDANENEALPAVVASNQSLPDASASASLSVSNSSLNAIDDYNPQLSFNSFTPDVNSEQQVVDCVLPSPLLSDYRTNDDAPDSSTTPRASTATAVSSAYGQQSNINGVSDLSMSESQRTDKVVARNLPQTSMEIESSLSTGVNRAAVPAHAEVNQESQSHYVEKNIRDAAFAEMSPMSIDGTPSATVSVDNSQSPLHGKAQLGNDFVVANDADACTKIVTAHDAENATMDVKIEEANYGLVTSRDICKPNSRIELERPGDSLRRDQQTDFVSLTSDETAISLFPLQHCDSTLPIDKSSLIEMEWSAVSGSQVDTPAFQELTCVQGQQLAPIASLPGLVGSSMISSDQVASDSATSEVTTKEIVRSDEAAAAPDLIESLTPLTDVVVNAQVSMSDASKILDAQQRTFIEAEEQIKLIRRSILGRRIKKITTASNSGASQHAQGRLSGSSSGAATGQPLVTHATGANSSKKRRYSSGSDNRSDLLNWSACQSLPVADITPEQEQDWWWKYHEGMQKVEVWMQNFRLARQAYWDEQRHGEQCRYNQQHLGLDMDVEGAMHAFGIRPVPKVFGALHDDIDVDIEKIDESNDFHLTHSSLYCQDCHVPQLSSSLWCWNRLQHNDNQRQNDMDGLMQCLDCSYVGCGPVPFGNIVSKEHSTQHYLLCNHNFGK